MDVYKFMYILIVAVHYLVFGCLLLTTIYAWNELPIYIYVSLVSLIARVIYSRDTCPLTILENHIRAKLNMERSRGFLKDYIIKPIKKVIKND